jgi:hypothetical protein
MVLIDVSDASVLTSKNISRVEAKAITVLIEEIEKRTGIKLPVVYQWKGEDKTTIIVGSEKSIEGLKIPYLNLLDELEKPG